MDLIDRKYRILQAIIDDYILTALPVGSRTISRKYEQKLSSATIRNEMSDLEELGYLDSPHTSAGRIPSNKAYRLYVDKMIHPEPLSVEETAFIQSCFDRRAQQVEDLSARIARALSTMTHYTTAVMTRAPREDQILSHLQMVPVSERRMLLILVMRSGAVSQKMIDLDAPAAPDALYTVSRFLSERLSGCPMSRLPAELMRMASEESREMANILRAMADVQTEGSEVSGLVVGGRSNLLSFPEYSDVDKAKALLSVLETKEKVVSLLSQQGEMEISVRIGPETGMEETKDCSIVTASYRLSDGRVNTIGLIGPTRMQYGKVLSVFTQLGRSITELLDEQDEQT
ncbi:MAG TPA: heat-inducible transcription repressor HrcA [Candidatus Ventricola gallistercoris]|nr:heat-inducible transcription repressor HrcA [Candidatus Ventricola gallistercoris]